LIDKRGFGLVERFSQSLNAARTENFANHLAVYQNANPLQIGAEFTTGCDKRVAAVMTEGCSLSTMSTFSHLDILSMHYNFRRAFFLLARPFIITQSFK
jgi:hypothetical protein